MVAPSQENREEIRSPTYRAGRESIRVAFYHNLSYQEHFIGFPRILDVFTIFEATKSHTRSRLKMVGPAFWGSLVPGACRQAKACRLEAHSASPACAPNARGEARV